MNSTLLALWRLLRCGVHFLVRLLLSRLFPQPVSALSYKLSIGSSRVVVTPITDHCIRNVLDLGGSAGLQPGEIDWP